MIAEIEEEAEIYCPFIVHETAFQMDDARTYRTTADAERLERCGMGESTEGVGTKDSRNAHSTSLPIQRSACLRAGREPLRGSVISGLSHRRRSKRSAVLVVADRREHRTDSV